MLKRPTVAELLFAAKCFAAAMLALYVAMRLGLPRPFWAPMTATLVAQPLAGAVRSKAVYRIIGTIMGSAMAVLLVPLLINYALLLTLALALWVGFCLYVSLLDRTPRSYAFILSGYTVGLVAFPLLIDSVGFNPATIFDVALARVEEITIGIVSATLVHSLFFPQPIGPVILKRMDKAIGDAVRWLGDATAADDAARSTSRSTSDYHRLAQDIGELRILSTHIPFDTSRLRWTANLVRVLQDRLAALMPLLSGFEERLQMLRALHDGAVPADWQALLDAVASWAQHGPHQPPAELAQLRARIAARAGTLGADAGWDAIVTTGLCDDLARVLTACERCFELRREIEAGQRGEMPVAAREATAVSTGALHVDRTMALMSALAAVAAICASTAFWILTGWTAGFAAPMLAAVFCTFFATQDDPVPAQKSALYHTTVYSTPLAGLYLLWLLPGAHSFEMLALTLAPLMLVMCVLLARPTTGPHAFPFLIAIFATLTLNDTGNSDISSFINGQFSQMAGFISAALFTGLFRSVSSQWTAHRLVRAGRAEFAQMAQSTRAPALMAVTVRMVDRIGLLAPRLASLEPGARDNPLGEVRVGLGMTRLLRARLYLQRHAVPVQDLLQALAAHFRTRPEQAHAPALLAEIDRTLRAACRLPRSPRQSQVVAALAAMRNDLFPDAAAYRSDAHLNPSLGKAAA